MKKKKNDGKKRKQQWKMMNKREKQWKPIKHMEKNREKWWKKSGNTNKETWWNIGKKYDEKNETTMKNDEKGRKNNEKLWKR